MSLDEHHAPAPHEIPHTTGVHWAVILLFVGGVALTIMQGFFVAGLASPFGRVWPSEAAATITLPASHLQ